MSYKHTHILMLLTILLWFNAGQAPACAQDIYGVGVIPKTASKVYSLSQLTAHNLRKEDVSKKVVWSTFYPEYKGQMEKLQSDILNNPGKYPLQELEDPSKSEPDAFRRWEYQMRSMPAEIVSPRQNLLSVHFIAPDNITFCQTDSFDVSINIKNVSGFDLPIFYFTITNLPGVTIDEKKLKLPEGLSFIKEANTFVFNNTFNKNATTNIRVHYRVGCDGRGGSPVLKGKLKIRAQLNWELNLIGYLLDYDKRKLYKVIDFGNKPRIIQFNNQTKY